MQELLRDQDTKLKKIFCIADRFASFCLLMASNSQRGKTGSYWSRTGCLYGSAIEQSFAVQRAIVYQAAK